ncbi:MAG: Gfo/Idh/MocA family oxidoreductase [Chloroflexota bacterium]|nr:Gfo/Idh/MocA family oxidoreductase [Chloroflexota bacterium]
MTVRIGFIGTGNIAQLHLERLQQIEEAELVALCDLEPERAQAAQEKFGGKVYIDYHEMLERERLDAVYICVPPFAHLDQELEAVKRGIHLYVEKPVTLDVELGERIEVAIRREGVVTACGYQWRYLDTVDRLKSLVDEEPIGLVVGYWFGGVPQASWWRNRYQSGGQLVEQTTHIVDLARYLLGDVAEVGAYSFRGIIRDIPGYNVDDASAVILKFESGAIGAVTSSCLLTSGEGTAGLTVLGRDLRVDCEFRKLRIQKSGQVQEFNSQCDPYLRADQAFVEAVATGDSNGIRSAYADGLKTVQVTLAANHAMQTGQIIHL